MSPEGLTAKPRRSEAPGERSDSAEAHNEYNKGRTERVSSVEEYASILDMRKTIMKIQEKSFSAFACGQIAVGPNVVS